MSWTSGRTSCPAACASARRSRGRWRCEPSVLLMDEPFAALDVQTRSKLQDFLIQVWVESGASVLFVTHHIDEALALADRDRGDHRAAWPDQEHCAGRARAAARPEKPGAARSAGSPDRPAGRRGRPGLRRAGEDQAKPALKRFRCRSPGRRAPRAPQGEHRSRRGAMASSLIRAST